MYNAMQTRDIRATTYRNVRTKRKKQLDANQKIPFGLGEGHLLLLRLWFAAYTCTYHACLSLSYKPRSLPYSSARHTVIVDSLSGSCRLKPEQEDVSRSAGGRRSRRFISVVRGGVCAPR